MLNQEWIVKLGLAGDTVRRGVARRPAIPLAIDGGRLIIGLLGL